MTEALPLLLDLDGQPVAERWTSDEEDAALSDEDEEFPELRGPFCSERGDPCFPKCAAALWGPGEAQTGSGVWGGGPGARTVLPNLVSSPLGVVGESLLLPSPGLYPPPTIPPLTGFLKELEQEMSRLREHRQQTALLEHQLRVETRPALTDLPPLPGAPMAGDSSPSITPLQEKETSPEPASLPQASSTTKKLCPLAPRSQQSTLQARKEARAATAPKASLAGAPGTTKTVTKRIKK